MDHLPGEIDHLPGEIDHIPGEIDHIPGEIDHIPGEIDHIPGKIDHIPGKIDHIPCECPVTLFTFGRFIRLGNPSYRRFLNHIIVTLTKWTYCSCCNQTILDLSIAT